MPNYQRIVWIGLAVAAIAILALGYFLFLAPAAEKKVLNVPDTTALARPPVQGDANATEAPDPDIVPLDLDLDQSDAAVRALIARGGIPAIMKEWLQQEDIVRMVVIAIDLIARGESPAAQLPFLAPAGKFSVLQRDGKSFMAPLSFRRYDSLVDAFTAVPDSTWVTWYWTLRPTLEKAFAELGYPGITFAQRIRQAIEQLTRAPLVEKAVQLEKKVLSYAFADIALEALNPAQKHLLRLGPVNAIRVQKKLRALAMALRPERKKNTNQ